MAIAKRSIHGLQDIRTYTGKPVGAVVPHMVYMRITCLEMEKARRSCERDSAQRRLNNIAVRFKEIEAEKRELVRALRQCRGERCVPRSRQQPRLEPIRHTGPFRVKY
jgi:hypothetical protein